MADLRRDERGLERLIFFSDAVIAIAITLLVLDFKVPEIAPGQVETELPRQVWALSAKFIGYVTSFLVIGLYWQSHHRSFRYINAYDQRLMIINLLNLMFIAFVPFPTSLLFTYPAQFVSVALYAGTMATIGYFSALIWWYATHGRHLVDGTLDARTIRSTLVRLLATPIIFTISLVLARFQPELAMYFWILTIPAYFIFRAIET